MLPLALLLLAADPAPADTAPGASAPTAPAPSAPVEPQSQSAARIAEKSEELRALFEQLECEKLIALAPYVEDHRLATAEQRHDAMFRRGYCLVVIGNTGEADQLFADIMREDAAAAPTFAMEPRVLAFVEAARNAVVKAREDAAAAEKAARVARIALDITETPAVKGGHRVIFDVKLTDPDHAVRSMRVDFRKKGELEYYALPVVKRADGTWHGEVPGLYTRSSEGGFLEWYLTVSDEKGEALKSEGARNKPFQLEVLPGSAIAEDLKANERLPHNGRVFLALAAPFALTAGSYAVAVATMNIFGTPFAFLALELTLPVAANYAVSAVLLDPGEALIPPLVQLVASGVVALTLIDIDSYRAFAGAGGPPKEGEEEPELDTGVNGVTLGLAGAVAATLVTTAVTTTLVALDAPE